jgi:Fe-S-cluster-containing dehydrogenase component
MSYAISLDISRCSGCMSCVLACMDQNDMADNGLSFRHVTKVETGVYPSARISFISLACFHCSDAPCLQACPKKALFRNEALGVVEINPERCIGCHVCAMVCPFGAPRFLPGEKMQKCNLCIERIHQGNEPACVKTCPTRALGFGTVTALSLKKADRAALKILEKGVVG